MTITLTTLPNATEQQVFDQVATHLMTQREVSDYLGNCMYRSDSGLSCAAGCLIADHEYSDDLEDAPWLELVGAGKVPSRHARFIELLQIVHDYLPVEYWLEALRRLAEAAKLNADALAAFEPIQRREHLGKVYFPTHFEGVLPQSIFDLAERINADFEADQ